MPYRSILGLQGQHLVGKKWTPMSTLSSCWKDTDLQLLLFLVKTSINPTNHPDLSLICYFSLYAYKGQFFHVSYFYSSATPLSCFLRAFSRKNKTSVAWREILNKQKRWEIQINEEVNKKEGMRAFCNWAFSFNLHIVEVIVSKVYNWIPTRKKVNDTHQKMSRF